MATQFMGHDPGRIWTGSQWDEVPQTRGNIALCGSSASKRGSFPGVPFSPVGGNSTQVENVSAQTGRCSVVLL